MLIALHKNATTTPAKRAEIQKATGSDYELARQFNVCRDTIRKWRKRDTVQDASHNGASAADHAQRRARGARYPM